MQIQLGYINVQVIRVISIVKLLNFIKGLQGVGIWGTIAMQREDKTAHSEQRSACVMLIM